MEQLTSLKIRYILSIYLLFLFLILFSYEDKDSANQCEN